jgi:uncharacterized protein YecE (DUF72 family)
LAWLAADLDRAALERLRQRLREHRQRDVSAWCIFDNTALGAALGNALTMAPAIAFDPAFTAAAG